MWLGDRKDSHPALFMAVITLMTSSQWTLFFFFFSSSSSSSWWSSGWSFFAVKGGDKVGQGVTDGQLEDNQRWLTQDCWAVHCSTHCAAWWYIRTLQKTAQLHTALQYTLHTSLYTILLTALHTSLYTILHTALHTSPHTAAVFPLQFTLHNSHCTLHTALWTHMCKTEWSCNNRRKGAHSEEKKLYFVTYM